MNIRGLSLETIPPIFIPLRFFLSAPLFGILASVLMLYSGADIWVTRWNVINLALTHLLTIGFILMVMFGALYQFIPVMTGQLIPGSKKLAPSIHIMISLGVLTLTAGFLSHSRIFFILALFFLSIGLSLFAGSLLPLLIARLQNQLIVFLLRILYLVLMVTLGIGLYMLLAYSAPSLEIAFRNYTDFHALWGLAGWIVLIIMAISSQVIPMFYVTPEFSRNYLKMLSLAILITLISLSLYQGEYIKTLDVLLSLELFIFVVYTLRLIEQRKRKIADVTIYFFRLSLVSLLFSIIIWWLGKYLSQQTFYFLIASVLIYGLAVSAITGMLHKIPAFLIFLHLQKLSLSRPDALSLVPNMKQVISSQNSWIQFMLFLLSYAFILVSVFFPQLTVLSAFFMLLNFSWLAYCLFQAIRLYHKTRHEILACPRLKMSI